VQSGRLRQQPQHGGGGVQLERESVFDGEVHAGAEAVEQNVTHQPQENLFHDDQQSSCWDWCCPKGSAKTEDVHV